MKSIPKLIRRFLGILLFSSILLIILNFVLLAVFMMGQASNSSPWMMAGQVAEGLQKMDDSSYILTEELLLELQASDIWGILIDNDTRQVVWRTENLPKSVPMSYTIAQIAGLTRGYIDDYPTFTGEKEDDLVVLGYPKESFWKHIWPSWDYHLIARLPQTVLKVLFINIGIVLLIYLTANTKLLKSVNPIIKGIQDLPTGEAVHLREAGVLSEISASINRTSDILKSQKNQLRKKETARANWIAGVSHDIRTPLSMVMGYAGQLREDTHLTDEERQKAAVIVKQSERIKNLINDLNLASKLEYNMQPIHQTEENMIAVVRQAVVDFINMDIDDKYLIEWETEESLTFCPVSVDKALIKRAVGNLIQNSMNHNEKGCHIYISVASENGKCRIAVSDDGVGATDEQIQRLNNTPHYMLCDENTTEQRHGLGLLIVKQIASSHGGAVKIRHSSFGGLCVEIILPLQ
ncbi:MAG: HAMP domain-containing sensor histidine kinase [Eubacteriales bacterium]|nr:HAMP domain-containing sensor histidine kinase [Eubacteriales bacterium]